MVPKDFPGGSDGKASAYNVGDLGSIPGSGRSPGEGNGNPLQYSCLENQAPTRLLHPWGRKESDMTEGLHFYFHNGCEQEGWVILFHIVTCYKD